MIARLAAAAARRPGAAGAAMILVGVWLTSVSVLLATGQLGAMLRRVAEVLAGTVS